MNSKFKNLDFGSMHVLSRSEATKIMGGAERFSCEMHFHSGGTEYVSHANVSAGSLASAENYNTYGPVNGMSTYTCCVSIQA